VDELLAQDVQSFFSVVGREHPKPFPLQNLGQGIPVRFIIIHQQNVL
jgi:hypothetical protein